MATGIVKWFNPDKNFGFIIPDAGGPDVFVHASALGVTLAEYGLKEGDRIRYDIGSNKGKSCAVNVVITK